MEQEACEGEPIYWIEDDVYTFIEPEELNERDCPCCEFMYGLFDEWMHWFGDQQTGELADPIDLERAFWALALEQEFSLFNWSGSETSVWDYELISIVRAVRARLIEQQQQEQARQAAQEKSRGRDKG